MTTDATMAIAAITMMISIGFIIFSRYEQSYMRSYDP